MRRGITLIFFFIVLGSCREPYQPPTILAQSNLLVVDAFLDGTNATCTVVLSRSQNVSDSKTKPMEKKATVQLEDSDGNVYTLKETSDGNYSASSITIDTQLKYQLKIKTEAGATYQSDFVEIKKTPPIDDLTWKATEPGIQFYVSTHDDEKKSIYYQYRFVETWEYDAAFPSNFEFQNGVPVPRADDIYHCWSTAPSSAISIATSVKLSDDVISNFPFYLIARPSEKYLIRYSILVKQNVLTAEAYNYWQQLQKNTEKIGTLFDPQPSQILSNIQNVNNESEPVLGYFNAGMTTEKRIFISITDLPSGWFFRETQCQADTVLNADLSHHLTDILIGGLYQGESTVPYGYSYTSASCGDCRLSGGTTTKPDFW
jgi:hypothetical protein